MELHVPIMIMESAPSLYEIQMESVSAIRKPGDLQKAEPTLTISASATDGNLLFVMSLLGEGKDVGSDQYLLIGTLQFKLKCRKGEKIDSPIAVE